MVCVWYRSLRGMCKRLFHDYDYCPEIAMFSVCVQFYNLSPGLLYMALYVRIVMLWVDISGPLSLPQVSHEIVL